MESQDLQYLVVGEPSPHGVTKLRWGTVTRHSLHPAREQPSVMNGLSVLLRHNADSSQMSALSESGWTSTSTRTMR